MLVDGFLPKSLVVSEGHAYRKERNQKRGIKIFSCMLTHIDAYEDGHHRRRIERILTKRLKMMAP